MAHTVGRAAALRDAGAPRSRRGLRYCLRRGCMGNGSTRGLIGPHALPVAAQTSPWVRTRSKHLCPVAHPFFATDALDDPCVATIVCGYAGDGRRTGAQSRVCAAQGVAARGARGAGAALRGGVREFGGAAAGVVRTVRLTSPCMAGKDSALESDISYGATPIERNTPVC